ncbi:Lsr2 family protein [Micromonospora sp. WMMD980]|uniref:histone-like nucleoid-structuring protein Lsr2 n=1 Tax=Micromonospora sp. WMMD980 TaxID=3016088 RepID=UPI00241640B4|nr:Lsr2 family protein [Micromonospora sp. WMMD980]MDG4803644.1 Lsr2 family protein [Micromonospora sp. WMMD980]
MSTRIIVVLTDDLDHSTQDVRTHRIALDGVEYEIDLAPHNLRQFKDTYLAAARRLPKRPTGRRPGPSVPTGQPADVRAFWAAHEQQLHLPPYHRHGPIPAEVYEAYRTATARTHGQERR